MLTKKLKISKVNFEISHILESSIHVTLLEGFGTKTVFLCKNGLLNFVYRAEPFSQNQLFTNLLYASSTKLASQEHNV